MSPSGGPRGRQGSILGTAVQLGRRGYDSGLSSRAIGHFWPVGRPAPPPHTHWGHGDRLGGPVRGDWWWSPAAVPQAKDAISVWLSSGTFASSIQKIHLE